MDERNYLEELNAMPEYQKLTPKQKLFCATYCVPSDNADWKPDAVSACLTAYQCKNRNVARVMSYGLLQNIRILEVLNHFFKRTPPEEFLISLDRAIRNKHLTIAQVTALKMKCDILKFANKLPRAHTAVDLPSKDVPEIPKGARKKRTQPEDDKPAEPSFHEVMANRFKTSP